MIDVLIRGAGLAANLLARQLRLELPELEVVLVDPLVPRPRPLGEATVEVAGAYLSRLGLGEMLAETQLPKSSIRLFFDGPDHNSPLSHMSEVGPVRAGHHPSWLLDRRTLDAALLKDNRRLGVRVLPQDAPARWVVDATGAGPSHRPLGTSRQAVWARFEGVENIDSAERPFPSGQSAVHFAYRGRWIWHLRLPGGLTSIGVVGDVPRLSADAWLPWLRRHRALEQLLPHARAVDFGCQRVQPSFSEPLLEQDRARTGGAALRPDPLYSPGLDLIAWQNEGIVEVLRRQAAGQHTREFIQLYAGFVRLRAEVTAAIADTQYGGLGSYDLVRLRHHFDRMNNLNVLSLFLGRAHLDEDFLRHELGRRRVVLGSLHVLGRVFDDLAAHLEQTGEYHRHNVGFRDGPDDLSFQRGLADRSPSEVADLQGRLMSQTLGLARRWRLGRFDGPPAEGWMPTLWEAAQG